MTPKVRRLSHSQPRKEEPMMKRCLALMLLLTLLLTACAQPTEDTPSSSGKTEASSTATLPEDSQASQPTQTTGQTEPSQPKPSTAPVVPMKYQNPLTGEPMAEPYLGRPMAVMLNNIKAAMPQHGVSQADILYEVLAEGGITRCMGVFSDISQVEKVGSVRSARKYFVELSQGYNALYVHYGTSNEAKQYIRNQGIPDLDGMYGEHYFPQDKDRLQAGYSAEHTRFSSGQKLLSYAKEKKYATSYSETPTYQMAFDDDKVIVGETVQKITVYFNQGGKPGSYTKSTTLTYDANAKTYLAAQHGGNYIDGNTKETVSFRNVVVLRARTSQQSGSSLMTIQTTGTGTGYFSCNGQLVPIKWSRASVNDPFTYTLENGNPVTFGVGSTYVAVVPTNATVNYQ